jgi:deoxyribonuclease V
LVEPLVQRALALRPPPEVVLIDGFGGLHPQRAGAAVLCGRACGVPTVGVAKSLLVGARGAPSERAARGAGEAGALSWPVVGEGGEEVAVAVRAHAGVTRPVWVSSGHKVPLHAAVRLVKAMARHRGCEPLRLADQGARARVAVSCRGG